ncbi:NADH-quinone oxidoreductase subunit J [bacterium CG_4_9_14_3_um_filter_65_15]|nr:MAG: NADH-quinone oxidoreductase subunit J [bacterium CG_4_9_14_3_um_filter_65_15]
MEGLLFWFCGSLLLLGGVMMVVQRSAVVSALWLVFAFLSAAGIFAVLGGTFLAVMQVLVYAGAIMVLFLFVIMMLQGPVMDGERRLMHPALWPLIAAPPAAVLIMLAGFLRGDRMVGFAGAPAPGFGSVVQVATLLLGRYLLAFELISIILLVALIGALAVGRGERKLPWK